MKLIPLVTAFALACVPATAKEKPAKPKKTPEPAPAPAPAMEAHEETPAEKGVREECTKLGEKIFGKRLESLKAVAAPDKTSWIISAEIYDPSPSPVLLQEQIKELAAKCHPDGMKVSNFTVDVTSDFSDGLGNSRKGHLLTAKVKPEVEGQVKWANWKEIDFHRAFSTTAIHKSFANEWNSTNEDAPHGR